jgi:hypothetical protein
MKKSVLFAIAVAVAWVLATAPDAQAQGSTSSPTKVKAPVSAVKGQLPPANAKKATSVGKGKTTAKSSNAATDQDSVWVQEIDIDGDGDVEEVDLLWDDEDKVLFLYDEADVACALTTGTASSSLLVALYGQGNAGKKPVGSGWYVVDLDAGECAVEEEDLYGCKFDASGNPTACAAAEIDYAADDLVWAEAD